MLPIVGILFIVLGFVLIGIEVVIPGFGLPGIGGIISMAAGVILTAKTVEQGIMMTIIIIVLLAIMATIIMTILHYIRPKSPIVLDETIGDGVIDSEDLQYLLQKRGNALTDLKPVGRGRFEGIDFDIRSEGAYIVKGAEIEIVEITGNQLIVRQIKSR